MRFLGIELDNRYIPPLERDFVPAKLFYDAYQKLATIPLTLTLCSERGSFTRELRVRAGEPDAADYLFVERTAKTLLWQKGGHRLYVDGPAWAYDYLAAAYKSGGAREFDCGFMSRVYSREFEVARGTVQSDDGGSEAALGSACGFEGCRIGLDVGGSRRKVCAVIEGKTVFRDSVEWEPSSQSDWRYHFEHIKAALESAASALPRVDGIGISTAGVVVGNELRESSLFRAVPREDFAKHVRTIFLDAAAQYEGAAVRAANDGDVSALCGAIAHSRNNLLGISMGTSEAGGYVDAAGALPEQLSELAFVPVDLSQSAPIDEWSGDRGTGVDYFSSRALGGLALQRRGASCA